MKHVYDSVAASRQTKAISLLAACIACSLLLSMTVVTYVVKWLVHS